MRVGQAAGEVGATRRDAKQHEIVRALVAFEDLVRDAAQRATDLGGRQDHAAVVGSGS